jgi:hypothetical protein
MVFQTSFRLLRKRCSGRSARTGIPNRCANRFFCTLPRPTTCEFHCCAISTRVELLLTVNSASGMIPKLISYRLQLMPHLGAVHRCRFSAQITRPAMGLASAISSMYPISQELTLRRSTGLTTAVKRWLESRDGPQLLHSRSCIGHRASHRSSGSCNTRSRTAGDPATLVADASREERMFHFKPKYSDLETIIQTTWRSRT